MSYALLKDGVVVNIIWLSPSNATDFPNAVQTNGLPIRTGDTYVDGIFYRDGERILSAVESMQVEMEDMRSALELLGVTTNG